MRKYCAQFNYIGELWFTKNEVLDCSHSGQCDEDVKRTKGHPKIRRQIAKINPEALRKELREYGAWDETELKDHEANLERIVWIACNNIMDTDLD